MESPKLDPTEFLKPQGEQVQKGLKYLDMGIKLELLLYQLHSILFWISAIEAFTFSVGLLFFLRLLGPLALIFLYTPHMVRAVLGIVINGKLPRSHHIIREMQLWHYTDGHPKFSQVFQSVRDSMTSQFGLIF